MGSSLDVAVVTAHNALLLLQVALNETVDG